MASPLLHLITSAIPLFVRSANSNRLTVLIFHGVLPEFDYLRPDEPTAERFEWQMRVLKDHFNPLPLSHALDLMEAGTLPPKSVCVTFDDGYANNESVALPILKKLGIPATVFVATDFLDGGRMWNDSIIEAIRNMDTARLDLGFMELGQVSLETHQDRLEASRAIIKKIKHLPSEEREQATRQLESMAADLPNDLMLTRPQLINLSQNGIVIGAHTMSHPILTSLNPEAAEQEIVRSKQILEALLDQTVELFAYPNGKPGTDYNEQHTEMVKKSGFKACVSTHWGAASQTTDRWQIPRFTPWDKDPLKFAIRLLLNYRNAH